MSSRKTKSGNKKSNTALRELFKEVMPTSLALAVQEAARQEGWISPWDRAGQQYQKKRAGNQSAFMRAGRVGVRRLFVKTAFDRLKPTYQMQPYSEHSIDALEVEYRRVLAEGDEQHPDGFDPNQLMSAAPFKADRDTLKKDLKALGIRSKRRAKRSG